MSLVKGDTIYAEEPQLYMKSTILTCFALLHTLAWCGADEHANLTREERMAAAFGHWQEVARRVNNTGVVSLLVVTETSTRLPIQRFRIGLHEERPHEWRMMEEEADNSVNSKIFLNLSCEEILHPPPYICTLQQWNSRTTGGLPSLSFAFTKKEDALGFAMAFKRQALEIRRQPAMVPKLQEEVAK